MALAALLAVASKLVLRVPRAGRPGTKHVLNPTNGAIVLLLACGAPVWVSPGQWGHHLALAFGVAGFGSLVVHRSARSDVTLAFLAAWAGVLFVRAWHVGQPWGAPLHQLESGSLALFAFHMISDPRTTPDSRAGRIVFATLVALGAGAVQFLLFRTNGLLWSLAGCSFVVPLLDRWLPGREFRSERFRDARGAGRRRRPVLALSHERAPVVPRRLFIRRPVARSLAPGPRVRVVRARDGRTHPGGSSCVVGCSGSCCCWRRALRLTRRTRSVASSSRPATRSSSTTARRSRWCATAIARCSPWPATTRATPGSSRSWSRCRSS